MESWKIKSWQESFQYIYNDPYKYIGKEAQILKMLAGQGIILCEMLKEVKILNEKISNKDI